MNDVLDYRTRQERREPRTKQVRSDPWHSNTAASGTWIKPDPINLSQPIRLGAALSEYVTAAIKHGHYIVAIKIIHESTDCLFLQANITVTAIPDRIELRSETQHALSPAS